MIEKSLLVYRRRLDQKKKQCITQKHQLKTAQEKKERTKDLLSVKTEKCNRALEKHENGHLLSL